MEEGGGEPPKENQKEMLQKRAEVMTNLIKTIFKKAPAPGQNGDQKSEPTHFVYENFPRARAWKDEVPKGTTINMDQQSGESLSLGVSRGKDLMYKVEIPLREGQEYVNVRQAQIQA